MIATIASARSTTKASRKPATPSLTSAARRPEVLATAISAGARNCVRVPIDSRGARIIRRAAGLNRASALTNAASQSRCASTTLMPFFAQCPTILTPSLAQYQETPA
jgi:hypothetical protein